MEKKMANGVLLIKRLLGYESLNLPSYPDLKTNQINFYKSNNHDIFKSASSIVPKNNKRCFPSKKVINFMLKKPELIKINFI